MRKPQAHRPGTHLARCARWLGIDRNPLRRPTDRIEAAIRLVTLILITIGIPLAAITAGQLTDHQMLRQAASDHQVTAVLLQRAASTGVADPIAMAQTVVPARWQAPGQSLRTGEVAATAGAPAGSTVKIWVDGTGALTDRPDDGMIAAAISVAAVNTCLAAGAVVLISNGLARYALQRRRLSAWDAEWRATGPLWSGHRS